MSNTKWALGLWAPLRNANFMSSFWTAHFQQLWAHRKELTMIPCLHLKHFSDEIQYIPRNMHTVFALLYFVVVIHWLIFPHPSGLLHWHCGNLPIAPVPAKQPWWIWINISCEFIMNDCITTTKQSTTKPCAYFLGYTVAFKKTFACCIVLLESLCIHFYISFLTILAQSRFTGCHDFIFHFISKMTSLLEEISFGSNHRIWGIDR